MTKKSDIFRAACIACNMHWGVHKCEQLDCISLVAPCSLSPSLPAPFPSHTYLSLPGYPSFGCILISTAKCMTRNISVYLRGSKGELYMSPERGWGGNGTDWLIAVEGKVGRFWSWGGDEGQHCPAGKYDSYVRCVHGYKNFYRSLKLYKIFTQAAYIYIGL